MDKHTDAELDEIASRFGQDEQHFDMPRLVAEVKALRLVALPDLSKTSVPELMQRLAETEEPQPTYAPLEIRVILHEVREVVRAAWVLMDNTEDDSEGTPFVQREDWDRLSAAMDRLDEIAALDTSCSGQGGHAVTMAMDLLAANNKRVRNDLVRELSDNILALNCGERSKELAKAGFLAALMKYNRDHANAAPVQS